MIRLERFPVETGRYRVSFYDQFTVMRAASGLGHGGVDIGSHQGVRIFAATTGFVPVTCNIGGNIVPGAGRRRTSGNYVVLVDAQGYFYYYLHMQPEIDVEPGDDVEAGQPIGFMSNSGLSARSRHAHMHLHFQAVNHLRGRSGAGHAEEYRTREFTTRNRANRNPYSEHERLALALPRAYQSGGYVDEFNRDHEVVRRLNRDGVIIEPDPVEAAPVRPNPDPEEHAAVTRGARRAASPQAGFALARPGAPDHPNSANLWGKRRKPHR